FAGHHHLARIGQQLAADQAQQRGFTGATGAHNGGDFAARKIHRQIVKDHSLATAETQPADRDIGLWQGHADTPGRRQNVAGSITDARYRTKRSKRMVTATGKTLRCSDRPTCPVPSVVTHRLLSRYIACSHPSGTMPAVHLFCGYLSHADCSCSDYRRPDYSGLECG